MPEAHRLNHAIEQFELPVVQFAAKTEGGKVNQLRTDLSRVLTELRQEQEQLQRKRKEAEEAADALQTQISEELMPRVKESAETLKGQNDRRDLLLFGKSLLNNVEQLQKQQSELEVSRADRKNSVPKINSTASTGEMDAFAQVVETILKAWKYPNPVNYLQVQFANDSTNLYGHVKLASPYALFSDYYSHLFVDGDLNAQTGYPVTGALFGSEMMIESGFGYDQRNGSFNAGSILNLGWAVAPSVSTNEFEFEVSLAALYPDSTKVFGTNAIRLLLQDNRGPETAVATGIAYVISPPQLGPLFISQSNGVLNIIWSSPGTLQSATSLSAGDWTNLNSATSPYIFQAGSGQQFFRLAQ
jgi:hypothetical protein